GRDAAARRRIAPFRNRRRAGPGAAGSGAVRSPAPARAGGRRVRRRGSATSSEAGLNATEFERRYRVQGDPWAYRSSGYERAKYDATLRACGPGPFAAALELGGSIGVFSARLAPRCRALTTIDFSPTGVRAARA